MLIGAIKKSRKYYARYIVTEIKCKCGKNYEIMKNPFPTLFICSCHKVLIKNGKYAKSVIDGENIDMSNEKNIDVELADIEEYKNIKEILCDGYL